MKISWVTIITLWLFFFTSISWADDYVNLVQEGNKAFTDCEYKTAMEKYHAAETEIPESPELFYNIGGAAFKQGDYEQAVDNYTKALNTTDIAIEAQARYNLGNTYFRMGDYQNAITSYEKSLEINPEDLDAKYNLELARKMLKENTKPQQQEQQQQQNKQEQENQQDQQNKDQQENKQDQQNQDQQEKQQDQQNQDEQQQQKQQQQEKNEISKEDAERILNALRDDEQDIQKKIKRQKVAGNYSGKDW